MKIKVNNVIIHLNSKMQSFIEVTKLRTVSSVCLFDSCEFSLEFFL
jgi:hypothetical protein